MIQPPPQPAAIKVEVDPSTISGAKKPPNKRAIGDEDEEEQKTVTPSVEIKQEPAGPADEEMRQDQDQDMQDDSEDRLPPKKQVKIK